jgi:hypothetical protein
MPVYSAEVTIMGTVEGTWTLAMHEDGYYFLDAHLPENQSYVLSVHLGTGRWYLSEEIHPIETPDFDISYQKRDGDLKIYANTYGNENARYFMWEYEETWVYRTPYTTYLKYEAEIDQIIPKEPDEVIARCWSADHSTRIILESSSRYENNQIFQKELLQIDSLSEKLGVRYHIKVKQKAMDINAYTFWETIRRNSDDIGDIFSPMPSQTSSNIYNVEDPDEPVIGYISAGRAMEKSIYINGYEINWRSRISEYLRCDLDTVSRSDTMEFDAYIRFGGYEPVMDYCEGPAPCGVYLVAPRICTDCRLRGGSAERPEFWVDQ